MLQSPIIAFLPRLQATIDQQVLQFASVVDEKSNACLPLLTDTMEKAVKRFSGTEDDTSENINQFVGEILAGRRDVDSSIPAYCGENMLFRSITREQVEKIMSVLAEPAKLKFEEHIKSPALPRTLSNVDNDSMGALLKCCHIALEVLGPVMRKYAKFSSASDRGLRSTCENDTILKEIILGIPNGFAKTSIVDNTIYFLDLLFRADKCYHATHPDKLSDSIPEDVPFLKFEENFMQIVSGPPSPVVTSPPSTASISPPNIPDAVDVSIQRGVPADPSTEPRRIEDQSFRSLSIVNEESIFFANLAPIVYRISKLSIESVRAAVYIRTLHSYIMVLTKALDHLGQLQSSRRTIGDKLTAVLAEVKSAIGQPQVTAPRAV